MTTLVGVLGWPVAHSRSPAMHNAAFEELGLDWRYELLPVEPDRFGSFVRELPGRGFVGANVTIPHKLRAFALADVVSDVARATGAANTLRFSEHGGEPRIEADNTDVAGFLAALRERAPGAPGGMDALVLGAGGAGRGVVYALLAAGAARVAVWNRDPKRARGLVQDLDRFRGGARLEAVSGADMPQAELLVNATSVGMATEIPDHPPDPAAGVKELPVSADVWGDRQIVVDLVYRQDGTPLARLARSQGVVCVDGFDVLVHQGAASFRLWTGLEAPLGAMRRGTEHGKTKRPREAGSEAGPR
jgi:shikimate dehydrogenase